MMWEPHGVNGSGATWFGVRAGEKTGVKVILPWEISRSVPLDNPVAYSGKRYSKPHAVELAVWSPQSPAVEYTNIACRNKQ